MKKEKLIETLKNDSYAQRLGKNYDGGCPCSLVKLKVDKYTFCFHSRCWRVSNNLQDLYVWGTHPDIKELAELVKENLDKQEWYNPYTIIYQEF